jgi:hypothetical protein
LRKYLSTSILLISVTIGAGWAAKPKAKPKAKPVQTKTTKPTPAKATNPQSFPVSMQAVGTFDETQPAAKITIFASPDESEPASFTIKSPKPFTGVAIKLAGDLTTGSNKLPTAAATIFQVSADTLMPIAPFDLQAGDSQRFWMTINVPVRTPAGVYKGAVAVVAGGKVIGKLPIELTVLPMRLLKSSKQYGILLPSANTVDESYIATLNAIRINGFGLASTAVPIEELPDAVAAINDAKLGTTIPYINPDITAESVMPTSARSNVKLLYSVGYDPKTDEQIGDALTLAESLNNANVKTFTLISDPAAFDRLAGSVNYLIDDIDLPYIQGLLSGEKRANGRNEWLFWNIADDSIVNRLNAGLLLWKSGLDGAFPPLPSDADPVIGTAKWEALREGVDDTRYITTMMSWLREVKDLHKGKDTTDAAEAYLNAVLAKPLAGLTNKELQAIRWQIAQYAIKLEGIVKRK